MPVTETETQVKILKSHLGLKKDEITKVDAETAKDLIAKGIAEEVVTSPETIEAAIADIEKSFDAKLLENNTKLVKELDERFAKGIRGLKPKLDGKTVITVGKDGWENDPTGGFRSLAEFSNSVVKACRGDNSDERLTRIQKANGASEGVAADGGYATPVQYAATIWDNIVSQDSLFNRCFKIPMNSSSIKLPAINFTQQGSYGVTAYWEGEGQTIPTSKPKYRQPSLTLNKLTALVPVTSELLEDGIAIEPMIDKLAAEAITYKINDAILNGTGAGMPVGIVGHASTVTVAAEASQTAATVNALNVLKMKSRYYRGLFGAPTWLINQDVEPSLYSMQDPAGRYLFFAPGSFAGNPDGKLIGYDVVPLINCQTVGTPGDIILFNGQGYAIGYKSTGPTKAMSLHLYFATDEMAFRWTFRMDGRPWMDAPVTAAKGSATYGTAVTLAVRA